MRRLRSVPALVAVLAGLLLLALGGCTRPPAQTADRVRIAVDADGLYQVSAGDLAAAGFDLAAARDTLSLSSGGEPVAFELRGRGKDTVLRFYGQALGAGAYTPRNTYWLAREGGERRLVREQAAGAAGVGAVDVVSATVHLEEDKLYHAQGVTGAAGETLWYWESIFAPAVLERTLLAPHAAAGPAELRVFVLANSSAPVDPDHRLRLTLNGTDVADATWDGLGARVVAAQVPAGVLKPGENTLTLTAPGDTGAPADALLLDKIELSYPRGLVLDTELAFEGDAPGYRLSLAGEAQANRTDVALWDVMDPRAPVSLAPPAGGGLGFAAGGPPRRYIAASAAGLRKPAAIAAAPASALPDWPGGADMIVVTVPQFREALAPLVAAREAQGLRVAVLDVEEVYDAFSYGRPGPEAIRNLVRHAASAWTAPAPRYLLLAGDASYDPLNRLNGTEADLVPTRLVHTAFSGWSASDVWYTLPDDTPAARPTLAAGRLPAQTAAQLAAMVGKALAYEKAGAAPDWRKDVLLVADNDEGGFAVETAEFATGLGRYNARQNTIEGDGSAARGEIMAAFRDGAGLIGYFGHGAVTLWAKEKVLAAEDAAALTNRERLPVVFTVTCLTGLFEHPRTPSLAEALLRNERGGAVAALVPSSAAVLSDQRLLAQGLAAALQAAPASPRRLGDIVREAQAAVPARGPGVEDILLTFNLLGDPSLVTSF